MWSALGHCVPRPGPGGRSPQRHRQEALGPPQAPGGILSGQGRRRGQPAAPRAGARKAQAGRVHAGADGDRQPRAGAEAAAEDSDQEPLRGGAGGHFVSGEAGVGSGSRARARREEKPRSANPRMVEKKSGMKKIPMVVANSIPANTPVPSECRLPAPAPLAITSGETPRMKANDVMRMGRNRSRAASMAASRNETPRCRISLANSTIRIAFLAAS